MNPDIQHNTNLLIAAAMQGDYTEVERLIPISDPKINDSQALYFAAANGHAYCVERLIPVSDPLCSDSLALRLAVCNKHLACVKLLLGVSDPQAANSSIMLAAVLSGDRECVDLLYPLSDLDKVVDMLHKNNMERVSEWWWFKERLDNEKLNNFLSGELPTTTQQLRKKI